jgi:hypothetical protein
MGHSTSNSEEILFHVSSERQILDFAKINIQFQEKVLHNVFLWNGKIIF